MPSLGYGKGAAQFVDNFIRSYYAGKDYEQQSKRQDYLTLLQGLSPQLESPDVPFSQKTKLSKILLSQAGIKDHAVLEDVFSQMEQLDQQNVDTGDKNTLVDMSQANAQKVTPDSSGPQVLDPGNAPNLETPIFKKRGDITPRELQTIYKNKQDAIDFKQDIAKTRIIGEIQDERELNKLKAQGWKGNDEILLDQDRKQYFQQFVNPFTGEVKRYYYPANAVPKSVVEKNITGNKLTGKLGQLTLAQNIVSEYEADNKSHSYGDYQAAKSILDDFEKTGQVKDAQFKYLTQGISGTREIQPAQQAQLTKDDTNRAEDLSLKLSDAESKVVEFDTEYTTKGDAVRGAAENLAQAKKDLDEGNIDQKQYNLIEKQFNTAVAAMNAAKAKRDAAITNRDNIKSTLNKRVTKSSGPITKTTDKKAAWKKYVAENFGGDENAARDYNKAHGIAVP